MTLTSLEPASTRAARWELLPGLSAAASLGCLSTHVVLFLIGGAAMATLTLSMLGLSLLCASCSFRGWTRRCSDLELIGVIAVSVAMVALHLLLAPMHHGAGAGHAGHDMHDMSAGHEMSSLADGLMHTGLTLAVVAGLLAVVTLVLRRR